MNPAEFLSLLHARHCQRAFTDEPVSRDVLEAALLAAGQALLGKHPTLARDRNHRRTTRCAQQCPVRRVRCRGKPQADYDYSLQPQPEEWMDRARACGYALFELKGIAREMCPRARRTVGRISPSSAPGAHDPASAGGAERGNFLDAGMFLQNLMLALTAQDLGSCPQYSVAGYADGDTHLGTRPIAGLFVAYRWGTPIPRRRLIPSCPNACHCRVLWIGRSS